MKKYKIEIIDCITLVFATIPLLGLSIYILFDNYQLLLFCIDPFFIHRGGSDWLINIKFFIFDSFIEIGLITYCFSRLIMRKFWRKDATTIYKYFSYTFIFSFILFFISLFIHTQVQKPTIIFAYNDTEITNFKNKSVLYDTTYINEEKKIENHIYILLDDTIFCAHSSFETKDFNLGNGEKTYYFVYYNVSDTILIDNEKRMVYDLRKKQKFPIRIDRRQIKQQLR
ncbi:MAG: hypothetical protein E7076_05095 [Bacteroidales bacterium]|jgi:hypothetical protein|nr:hypothetical protein [Bacteroidales bacterium]